MGNAGRAYRTSRGASSGGPKGAVRESGAVDYEMEPLCDYWAGEEGTDDWANGVVFHAVVHALDKMPPSEMAEVKPFDALPQSLTYPEITPVLFQRLFAQGNGAGATA